MVSKLKFKNKIKIKNRIEKPSKEQAKPASTQNIEKISIDRELVSNLVKSSWCSASDITDSVNVVICSYNLVDFDDTLELDLEKLMEFYKTLSPYVVSVSNQDQVIVNNDSDFSILTKDENKDIQNRLNLTANESSLLKINSIVPESKSQLFKLIIIPDSTSSNTSSYPLKLAFKLANNQYLSADKRNSRLTLSPAMTTENEIFVLRKIANSDVDINWYSITQGNRKLILHESNPGLASLRLVEDEDDLIDPLNRFVLRIPLKDDPIGKKILQNL